MWQHVASDCPAPELVLLFTETKGGASKKSPNERERERAKKNTQWKSKRLLGDAAAFSLLCTGI
jgi:hypothetical protein